MPPKRRRPAPKRRKQRGRAIDRDLLYLPQPLLMFIHHFPNLNSRLPPREFAFHMDQLDAFINRVRNAVEREPEDSPDYARGKAFLAKLRNIKRWLWTIRRR